MTRLSRPRVRVRERGIMQSPITAPEALGALAYMTPTFPSLGHRAAGRTGGHNKPIGIGGLKLVTTGGAPSTAAPRAHVQRQTHTAHKPGVDYRMYPVSRTIYQCFFQIHRSTRIFRALYRDSAFRVRTGEAPGILSEPIFLRRG